MTHFYRTMLAWYMMSPCVHPSHAGVVPKRLNTGSWKQCHTIVRGLFFLHQRSRQNSSGVTHKGGAKQKWGRLQWAIFYQYLQLYISQKQCKTRTNLLWNANRNSYVLYRIMCSIEFCCFQWPWVTLSNYPKPHHFRHFISPFISS